MKNRPEGVRARNGATLVEVIVAIVLIALFFSLLMYVFQYSKKGQQMTEKLDALHAARMVNFQVSSELKFSSGVLFPVLPSETGKSSPKAHQVIYRDAYNRVKAIILDNQKRLLLLDYDRLKRDKLTQPQILGRNVDSFDVLVYPNRTVEFRVLLNVNKQTHEVLNQILPANQF